MDIDKELLEILYKYKEKLHKKIKDREIEMQNDNTEHYMVYNALGFTSKEGYQIDYQQNVGRFLYKYAGSMLEEMAIQCFKMKYPASQQKFKLSNTIDNGSPKTVEIDCLVGNKAYEIKWKDATTDGDHINKEYKRIRIIKKAGYIPVRIMFFEPNRIQAVSIQTKLRKLYKEIGGEYYSGNDAWNYIKNETGIDLKNLFESIKE